MRRFTRAAWCVALLVPVSLAAQGRRTQPRRSTTSAAERGAAAITEADIHTTIFTLADDSMLGRATPSPQLEETAQYVAAQFRSFGLQPGGDSGTFFQRYPIDSVAIDSASHVSVTGAVTATWQIGRELALGGRDATPGAVTGPMVLMWGVPADSAHPFGTTPVRGAVVLYVAPSGFSAGRAAFALQQAARAEGAAGWITVRDLGAAAFAGQAANALRPRQSLGGMPQGEAGMPAFTVRDSTALPLLAAAGVDLATVRTAGQSGIKPLEGVSATVELRRSTGGHLSAPNVIGVLPGSDTALRRQYVFFTGHMDHVGAVGPGRVNVGCGVMGADSICNGADDDASGTTTVIELARAFSRMNPHPRRTLVFMTVSGEERGLWGSSYYSEHPLFPLDSTVADLNADMVGRYYNNQVGWKDTIVAIGKEHSDLGAAANRVVAAHPELHMNLIDDIWPQENFYFRSDHYNFARKGVPILFFFNGTHPDYHRPTDSPDKIDTEKMMRIARMVFYLGLDVANADQKPQWNPESRRRIVEAPGR